MDPAAAALNASVGFDRRLLHDDVHGSQAHARMWQRWASSRRKTLKRSWPASTAWRRNSAKAAAPWTRPWKTFT
jgi:hypothetical protein